MFSNQILVILTVYLASNLSPSHAHKEKKFFRSDYFYLEATHSFYKTHSYPKPFAEAKRTCSWEGASLWYPEDQKEYDAVISHWNRTQPVLWIHVGITDFLAKGVFETLDGKRVEDVYHKWRKGEPNNNKGNENCIVLHPNGEMVDVPCDREAPFFCKKTLQSLEWNHQCNMPDLGYTFNVESGSCYKLHPTPLNWTEAYNVCSAEQSYLAVINNWVEVDNLVKLVKTAPMSKVAGSYLRGLYHSGFHNKFNEGWKTVKDAQQDKKFFRNDYHYLEATESFYKVHSLPKTFSEAKRTCSWEGASLWYPGNQKEANAVISYWNSTQPTWWTLYVGISDFLVKGVYETIDGKRVEDVYHNWRKGEPNDYLGKEDCVVLFANGQMIDAECDKKYPFFCKKTLQSLKWNQQCNTPDLDYTFNANSSSCYKLHSTPLNWTEAYNVCSAEQSYLAVINNLVEVDELVKLADTAPKNKVAKSYLRGLYHLGFHNRLNDGWKTVKGTSLSETVEWWGNQPSEGHDDQCGAMFYTGRMNQIDCGMKCFFICEHDVDLLSLTQHS